MPSSETQFGGPRANPGKPPGAVLGKARKRRLQKAAIEQAAIEEVLPPRSTRERIHPRDYFQSLLDDVTRPDEMRGAAARALAQFWPDTDHEPKLTREQREREIIELIGERESHDTISRDIPQISASSDTSDDTRTSCVSDDDDLAETQRLEAERDRLLAELAKQKEQRR